jgi:gliding motility-associated-like protein
MKINTIKLAAIFAMFISFLGIDKALASHFAAADLYMEYVGDASNTSKYRIVVNVYKACEPGNASLSFKEIITLKTVNGGFNQSWSVLGTNPKEDTLDQLCAGFKSQNSCRTPGSQFPAFVRRTYDTVIDLSLLVANPRQTDWVVSWTNSARNAGIANLVNPSNSLYIEGGLNNVTNPINSTPKFLIDPLPYICVNQPAYYLCGPFDVNNDSLDTKNQAPLIGANNPMTHLAPYTLNNPVNSPASNPYTVDALTGTASFTPTATGKFVLAFRCDEYQRNTGIPTGYIMRDVQVSVLPCNAAPPAVDSIPVNIQFGVISKKDGKSKLLTCPGNTVSFDVSSTSNSISNKVYMSSTNTITIPGSTFNVANNGTSKVTGTFTWTPTLADIGEHTFTAIASDSTCDINIAIVLRNFTVITIKVIDGIEAGEDVTICPLGGAAAQLFVRGADGLSVKWTDIDGGKAVGLSADNIIDPIAKPTVQTQYVVFTPDLPGYCKNKDSLTVFMDTTNKVNVLPENPIVLCRPDYLQLDAVPFGKPPITNMSCGAGNPSPVTIVDSLTVLSLLNTQSFDTAGGTTSTFPNDAGSVKQQFLIRRSELFKAGILPGTFRSLSFEVNTAPPAPTFEYSNFRIGMKCTDKNALDAAKGFETGVTTVYTAPGPITMPGGWQQFVFDATYNWDSSKNLIIEICYSSNATTLPAGNNPIIRFVPTNYVANLLFKGTTDVCNTVTNASIGTNFSRPLFNFTFNEAKSEPFKYTWYPGTLLSDSTIQQPLAYLPRSQKYIVETIGRSGCIVRDSADVYIPVHDYSVWPVDTAICFGEPAPLHAKNGFTYKWYEYKDGVYTLATRNATCWDCADPILTPKATTIYKIVVYDSVWCTDTLTARVEVMPLPDVHILNRDTIVKYGQSIQLLVNGARTYNWFQVGTMTNTNISNPIARPTERTDYVVGGIGKNGCRAYDTVTVDVDFRDNLFIPSAFSPNGDGKNDVFRISNLSFQRVLEFRVFNRWGQEVFYSNDNQHGWDGKWKGVPQDLGSYQYLIRLGYPDGLVETYKGEVTLVK